MGTRRSGRASLHCVTMYAPRARFRAPLATVLLLMLLCGTTAVQLVDALDDAELRRLRRLLPSTRLVQVIHVTGPESVDEARAAAPLVDTILLDSGNTRLAVKELGGTGRVHDWA